MHEVGVRAAQEGLFGKGFAWHDQFSSHLHIPEGIKVGEWQDASGVAIK